MGIGGEGRTAEIDGAYFGGHIRPENLAIDRIDRRLAENQSGKRQVVVAMRERGAATLAAMRTWMERENTTIIVVLCLVLAAKLAGDGISALAG